MVAKTEILDADQAGTARAADLLRAGALVAFPTETVYGLGADARNPDAVAGIYAAKGRPQFNPLIVHLAETGAAEGFVHWSKIAERLADAFWPGPLSLVLPLKDGHGLSSLVTAGLSTVALRVPAQPLAQTLLKAFSGPVAAPSANPSGRISPTTAAHVLAGLEGRIDAVLQGGPCLVGLESTIVGLADDTPTLLRSGGVSREAIEHILGHSLQDRDPAAITAPGQIDSHYAPVARVRLDVTSREAGEVLLGFGPVSCDLNPSPDGDLREAAANLFDHLHQLDRTGRPIAVSPIPHKSLGVAINDRLRRAAAPR